MKHVSLIAAVLLGTALCGCGGSGVGSGVVNTGPAVTLGTPTVEAIIPGRASSDIVVQDPNNLEVGQSIQFQLVAYNATGSRVVLSPDDFRSSDTTNTYGLLGSNSGVLITGNAVSTTLLYIGANYQGVQYSASYQVKPRQARLIGQIVDETTGLAIRNASLNFYNDSGQLVGTVVMPFQGSFRASIPLTATRFQVVSDSLTATYWRSFTFNGLRYDAGSDDCRAPLPALQIGDNFLSSAATDATIIRVTPRTGSVKPTADGCGF